jgi:glyoxylase-like metal-dependent hydrolase (beta-lactamase superfamily II)
MSSSSNWKVLLPGIPANSTRGFLGWCNVSLIKFTGKNEYALFDTGNNGDRKQLLSALQVSGITPSRINHLILSHLHYDHILNAELFNSARVYISARELEYFQAGANGDIYYPSNYLEMFIKKREGNIVLVEDGSELFSSTFLVLPGHTAGSLGLLFDDCVFAGDALKYASEAVSRSSSFAYYNLADANNSIKRIISIADTIVPGHDAPFRMKNGKIEYLQKDRILIEMQSLRGNEITL